MTGPYDRERDEGYVPSTLPSAFLGWDEDRAALEPAAWPNWADFRYAPGDFPQFLLGAIRDRMVAQYGSAVHRWADYVESSPRFAVDKYGGTYSITRVALPWWHPRRWLPW